MHMYTPLRQAGKGLVSFIIGLLLATLIIACILFFLNKSKSDFKIPDNPAASVPPQPEILTPANSTTASSQIFTPDTPASSGTTVETPETIPASQPVNMRGIENDITIEHTLTTQPPIPHKTPEKTPRKAPPVSHTDITPEQILNNGSLEKAQRAAAKQHSEDKVFLQIGSYNNRTDADAQRAKLVMLGINSSVHSAKVNGTIKYRVQTDNLSQNQAKQIKQTLQQHNIDSLTRTAS